MKMMNERELDVLNILYKTEEPMMVTDIVNMGEGLTQSTVTAVLRKLLREGLVEAVGFSRSGKVLSRTYRPSEQTKQCIIEHFVNSYQLFCNVITPEELCEVIKNL